MISVSIVRLYPLIENIVGKDLSSSYENYELLKRINQTNYTLYKDLLEMEKNKELTYDEIYINSHKVWVNYNDFRHNLNYEMSDWNDNINRRLKNLDYFAYVNNDETYNKTNTNNSLNTLVSNIKTQELNDKYDFYIVLNYDENGGVEVSNVHGVKEYYIKNNFSQFDLKKSFDGNLIEENVITFNPIKNATFIYAIPKELKYEDNISVMVNSSKHFINNDVLIVVIISILCSIVIAGLIFPYRKGLNIFGVGVFLKIPLEINLIILTIGAIFSGAGSFYVVGTTMESRFGEGWIGFGINTQLDFWLRIILNILMWIVIFYLIFTGDMLLKHIFKTGVVKYLKQNLLIIKIFKVTKKFLNRSRNLFAELIYYISNIDLTDKSNKFIIKIVAIDAATILAFLIIWALGTIFTMSILFSAFWGLLLAFVYCTVAFNLIKIYLSKIKNKFSVLLEATNKIAEGNLDVSINEDLGLFNPFKEQVVKIQNGFKKAVNEEVKSQRMKTELISNVSHDLKTPLTSIITYVDLLKSENITGEERKAYIATLDKKSQRLKFLIEDLFEVSRATSGNINLNLVKVDIVELIRQIEVELDDKIKKSNLKIRNNFPGNKIILNLDSQKTFRIFENLLNNVAKYAMEGSRVYVDVINNEDKVEITIKNMSAEEINFESKDIVERFERGDKSRNTEGSGLGLAIVKSFVEVQGGTFNVELDGDLFKVTITFEN
ncbi:alkaline phosphatase synthesis sensor protein PhoR [Clostridium puniceum]|uniref:histidine kinase n=2 Tax=Clostridium puniceum TaxID=29367 RepID=A0A1S8T2K1_9CLOT|nr:alkaline phosphatase synthesis sensor protein PhoR [Clostridium puniceum]